LRHAPIMRHLECLLLCVLACLTGSAHALDTVILDAPVSTLDRRNDYTTRLLTAILDKTRAQFGPYKLRYAPAYMYRDRLRSELLQGQNVNVTAKATRPDWENSGLITIRIPVDKGITEYRLFLINQQDQEKFRHIDGLDELKQLRLGVGHAWSSREVLETAGFSVESAVDWENLYRMLEARRFDYFPRALSEIFVEYDDRHATYPQMAIEDSLMLYFPLPKYFFVAPQSPRLAQRIETGFQAMIRDGSFDHLFMAYHKPLIERARFCSRRILRIENPLLSPQTPLDHHEYWFDPYEDSHKGNTNAWCHHPAGSPN